MNGMALGPLVSFVPAGIRSGVREALWLGRVRAALRRLELLPPSQPPTRQELGRLRNAWGNLGWSAEVEFLDELAHRVASTRGPILECGSGATTLLLSTLAARRGVEVWVLEHEPYWSARVARALGPMRVAALNLCTRPLHGCGEFDWYDAPLSRMPAEFRLVVCDGPPETTRGGRYGVVPMLATRLPPDAVLLLDNAARAKQKTALRRWERESGMRTEVRVHATCQFAIVTRSGSCGADGA